MASVAEVLHWVPVVRFACVSSSCTSADDFTVLFQACGATGGGPRRVRDGSMDHRFVAVFAYESSSSFPKQSPVEME